MSCLRLDHLRRSLSGRRCLRSRFDRRRLGWLLLGPLPDFFSPVVGHQAADGYFRDSPFVRAELSSFRHRIRFDGIRPFLIVVAIRPSTVSGDFYFGHRSRGGCLHGFRPLFLAGSGLVFIGHLPAALCSVPSTTAMTSSLSTITTTTTSLYSAAVRHLRGTDEEEEVEEGEEEEE